MWVNLDKEYIVSFHDFSLINSYTISYLAPITFHLGPCIYPKFKIRSH